MFGKPEKLDKFFKNLGATKKENIEPSKLEQKEGEDYNFEASKELKNSILSLFKEKGLKEAIDHNLYDALISDDTMAHLHTLVLRKIIQKRLELQNPNLTSEEHRDFLKTYFIANWRTDYGSDNKDDIKEKDKKRIAAIKRFFKKIRPDIKKRALLITERIDSGESVGRLSSIMEKAGLEFDIASPFINSGNMYRRYGVDNLIINGHKIYGGKFGQPLGIPPYMTGVANRNRVELLKRDQKETAHPTALAKTKKKDFGDYQFKETRELEYWSKEYNELYEKLKKERSISDKEEEEGDTRLDLMYAVSRLLYNESHKSITKELLPLTIKAAREDIDKISNEVIKEVWD